MALLNEVRIVGKIATAPKQKGAGPVKFRLSHGGGGKRKASPWPVQYFSVTVWDEALVKDLKKGDRIEIVGKLRDSSYTANDGTKRNATEIVADTIVAKPWDEAPTKTAEGDRDETSF